MEPASGTSLQIGDDPITQVLLVTNPTTVKHIALFIRMSYPRRPLFFP